MTLCDLGTFRTKLFNCKKQPYWIQHSLFLFKQTFKKLSIKTKVFGLLKSHQAFKILAILINFEFTHTHT